MTEIAREIVPVSLEDEMRRSYLDYAMSVIIWLALRWRAARETNAGGSGSRPVPARYLLLILYLFG
ncbi:MAG: hypothetical protein ACRESY_04955, partial [Steroidobacteraceae bacterium]